MIQNCSNSIKLTNYTTSFTKPIEISYPLKSPESLATVLGSCNGIYLIGISSRSASHWCPITLGGDEKRSRFTFKDMYLWNPATREYKQLPGELLTIPKLRDACRHIVYGLGYDALSDDFKVIQILLYFNCWEEETNAQRFESHVSVYSIRRTLCKRIQGIPYMVLNYMTAWCLATGLYLNGNIHWIGKHVPDGILPYNVVCFDVAKEEFREIEGPDVNITSYCAFHITFGLFEECLCVHRIYPDRKVDVFVMKEYGVKESWSKMFRIALPPRVDTSIFCKVLCITDRGKLLGKWNGNVVSLYDVEKGEHVHLKIHVLPAVFHMETYFESLLSLESGVFLAS